MKGLGYIVGITVAVIWLSSLAGLIVFGIILGPFVGLIVGALLEDLDNKEATRKAQGALRSRWKVAFERAGMPETEVAASTGHPIAQIWSYGPNGNGVPSPETVAWLEHQARRNSGRRPQKLTA